MLDPITLSVAKGALEEVVEEMDLTLERTAFSPTISESRDRTNGIYHPETGEIIVQGRTGLPVFIGTMQFAVQNVVQHARAVGFGPGDVFIVNDPFIGGTHLMDVKLVRPFYYRGVLAAWLANAAHWNDIGGSVPGGFAAKATEIYEEGLRLPPVKVCVGGTLNRDVVDIIMTNVRVPEERQGDLMAQISSLEIGAQRLTTLLDRYGLEEVLELVAELRRRSEVQIRECIGSIPDGIYRFVDHLDSDGIDDVPLRVDLELTVNGSEIHADFSKSSPPCRGPLNGVLSLTTTAVYIAIKHLFPEVPLNAGCFAPISCTVPPTTFLNAQPPAPVSGAAEVSQRVIDCVFGALAEVIPDRAYAGAFSSADNLTIGGEDPGRGRYSLYMFNGGGYGGSVHGDGLTNASLTISSARTQPMEVLEQKYPVLIRQFGIHTGSGGAGHHRGGYGIVFEMEIRRGHGKASIVADRGRFMPFGVLGGKPGRGSSFIFTLRGKTYVPPHVTKDEGIEMNAGDVVLVKTPGGGGYGNPLERPVEKVLRDVECGYITPEDALQDYGVVIDRSGEIDPVATERERSATLIGKQKHRIKRERTPRNNA